MRWFVVDHATNSVVRAFDNEDAANWLCRGLNLNAGMGGRYGVRGVLA